MTQEQEKRLEVIGAFYGRDAEEDTAFIAELLAMVDSLREELACKTDDAFFSVPALRAQVEGLKQEADTAFANFAKADATVQAHHRTIQKLLGLRKFARHLASCRLEGDPHMFNGCDCGLDAALRETEGLVKP